MARIVSARRSECESRCSTHGRRGNRSCSAHRGCSADLLKEVNGTPVGKMMWDAALANNQTSIVYDWVNPSSGKTEPKILFLTNLCTDDASL